MDYWEDIKYLDFEPGEVESSLRERALEAWGHVQGEHTLALQRVAYEKIAEILGETNGTDVVTKIDNPNDGDGTVELTVDGIRFQVKVVFPNGNGEVVTGQDPSTVTLSAQTATGNWATVNSLVVLGKLLNGGNLKEMRADA